MGILENKINNILGRKKTFAQIVTVFTSVNTQLKELIASCGTDIKEINKEISDKQKEIRQKEVERGDKESEVLKAKNLMAKIDDFLS